MRIVRITLGIAALAITGWAQIGNIVVTEAASFQTGWPYPGSIASIFCTGLTGISGIMTADHYPLPLEQSGVQVRIAGVPAPLFAVAQLNGYQQINIQVPVNAGLLSLGNIIDVTVGQEGQQSTARVSQVPSFAEFFRLPDGSGAFQHSADYALVSAANPTRAGEVVVGYLTGLPLPTPVVPTGQPAPAIPWSLVANPLLTQGNGESAPTWEVWVGGQRAGGPWFLGLTPGLVGVYQVNFTVPEGLVTGSQPVRLVRNTCTELFGRCIIIQSGYSLPVPMAVQ